MSLKDKLLQVISVEDELRDLHIEIDTKKTTSTDFMIRCPVHDDKIASCSVSRIPEKGWFCHACQASGSIFDLISKVNQTDFRGTLLSLAKKHSIEQDSKIGSKTKRIVKTYDYNDIYGNLIYQVVRYEPKDFRQRRPDQDEQNNWIYNLKGVTRVPYKLKEIHESTDENLLIVEGEKDVDNLFEIGFTATTNAGGAGKFNQSIADMLPEGRKIYIIPDNDEAGINHARIIYDAIRDRCHCFIVDIKGSIEKYDVSDFIDKHGDNARIELDKFIRKSVVASEFFRENKKTAGKEKEIKQTQKKSAEKINAHNLALKFMSLHHVVYYREDFYIYKNGCYRGGQEGYIRRYLINKLQEFHSVTLSNEFVFIIKHLNTLEEHQINRDHINVINGLIDINTLEFKPHSPEIIMTQQIPVRFNKNAHSKVCDAFLSDIFDSEQTRSTFEEFLGYSLTNDCRYEKALMLTGKGSNGKSILLSIMRSMLGENNVSNVSLQDIGNANNKYRSSLLVDKLANIYTDISNMSLKETGTFKMLVSGDEITVERKRKDPFSFKNTAKLIFSANDIPSTSDRTDGFYRRLIIIPMNMKFLSTDKLIKIGGINAMRKDERVADTSLREKLTNNDSVIQYLLNVALKGLMRLRANGGFVLSDSAEKAIDDYQLGSDSLRLFVDECLVEDDSSYVERKHVYSIYKDWMSENGFDKPLTTKRFTTRLNSIIPFSESRKRIKNHRINVLSGIRAREHKDDLNDAISEQEMFLVNDEKISDVPF